MAYIEHAVQPLSLVLLLVFYYLTIPIVIITWLLTSRHYISKGNYRVKRFVSLLLTGLIATSMIEFEITSMYVNLHSPLGGNVCFTSTCLLSSPPVVQYSLSRGLESYGLPSFGFMRVYRVYDVGKNATLGLPAKMNYLVVLRSWILLPVVDVYVYYVKGNTVYSKKSIRILWPEYPGSVLTRELGVRFTVFIMQGGGGEGV